MKKLMTLLVCLGMLVGCSNSGYASKVTDSDSVLVSGEGISITKQNFFEYLLDNYGASRVLSDVLVSIADKELEEDAINKLLEERKTTYANYSDGDLKAYAKSIGFETEDEFVNSQLLPSVKQELLIQKYITDNFDTIVSEYQVARFKKIIVDKESTALSIIKASTSEEAFDEQMSEYSDNAEDNGIVTKNSTLDENLLSELKDISAVSQDGVYSEAILLSDDTYAVIYVYDTARENKDEYNESLAANDDVATEAESYYLKKYNFTVHDSKIKDAISKLSSDYIE